MTTSTAQTSVDLRAHLGKSGEEEFWQLVSLLEDEPQAFALAIVKSDFDTASRDALLERLGREVAPVALHTISLSRDSYDLPVLLAQREKEINGPAIIAVTGLEETPRIAFDEAKAGRPLALAILNHGREAIRRTAHPLLLWCDPLAYAALREHAPDFFDHYTGLFTFLDAAPAPVREMSRSATPLFDSDIMSGGRPRLLSAISPRPVSPAAVRFYEEELERLHEPTPDRARALVGLAGALFASPDDAKSQLEIERIEGMVREALGIFAQFKNEEEHARAHALLATLVKRKLRLLNVKHPSLHPEVREHAEEALRVFSEPSHPIEWASLQSLLADYALEEGDNEDLLREAILRLQAAQRVFTRQAYPYLWAHCEMNLGNVFSKLPHKASHFKKAVSHFEAALRVYTRRDNAHEWALTQMLLGRAYSTAAGATKQQNERAKLMRRAIICYESSALGFAGNKELEHVALGLSLLAATWSELPTGNRRDHLRRSAECWKRAAGCIEDEASRATYLAQAALVLIDLGKLTKRSEEFVDARQTLEAAHISAARSNNIKLAEGTRQDIQWLDEFLERGAREHGLSWGSEDVITRIARSISNRL